MLYTEILTLSHSSQQMIRGKFRRKKETIPSPWENSPSPACSQPQLDTQHITPDPDNLSIFPLFKWIIQIWIKTLRINHPDLSCVWYNVIMCSRQPSDSPDLSDKFSTFLPLFIIAVLLLQARGSYLEFILSYYVTQLNSWTGLSTKASYNLHIILY